MYGTIFLMDRENQTIKLKDGRVLGYAEYGDPNGKPLFFFHGWPSARLAAGKYDARTKKLHIHIIAPDRPGYGLSDFKKDRKILDWPDDVCELADKLKIKNFAIMGVSGGGPYAAVCAYKIPDRITNAGIVVGLAPVFNWKSMRGMKWTLKLGLTRYGKYLGLQKAALIVQQLAVRYGFTQGLYKNNVFNAKPDRKMLTNPIITQSIEASYREAFRQGRRGPAWDLRLYTTDWAFDVSHINVKTYLWYAAADKAVSLAMGKYYYEHIRGSTLTIYHDEGHTCTITHAEEIFKTLIT